ISSEVRPRRTQSRDLAFNSHLRGDEEAADEVKIPTPSAGSGHENLRRGRAGISGSRRAGIAFYRLVCRQSGVHKGALEPDFFLQKGLHRGGGQSAIAEFALNLFNPPPQVDSAHAANGAFEAFGR